MEERKVMSLVEHLTELRARLIRCFIAPVIGMGVAWNFSGVLLSFVERPLTGHTYLVELKSKVYQAVRQRYPALYDRYRLGEAPTAVSKEDRKLNYGAPLYVMYEVSIRVVRVLARRRSAAVLPVLA